MLLIPENLSFVAIAVMVFLAVVLLLEGLYLLWKARFGAEKRRLEQRISALSADRTKRQSAILKKRHLSDIPFVEEVLNRLPNFQFLQRCIQQSGLNWTLSKIMLSGAVMGAAGFVGVTEGLHLAPLFGVLAGLVLASIPAAYVAYRRQLRLASIERQLPEALDLLARALRAGHAFSSGLQMAGDELPEPIGGEFRIVHDEITFGISFQQALVHLSERVPVTDLRYFVVAVLIQRESGGNLTEVLTNLSQLIRERLKLFAKIRVLSSEGRLSAWVLILMPFFLAGVMNLVNPEFMSLLWNDSIGITIIQYTLSLMAIGVLVIRRIVNLRV